MKKRQLWEVPASFAADSDLRRIVRPEPQLVEKHTVQVPLAVERVERVSIVEISKGEVHQQSRLAQENIDWSMEQEPAMRNFAKQCWRMDPLAQADVIGIVHKDQRLAEVTRLAVFESAFELVD